MHTENISSIDEQPQRASGFDHTIALLVLLLLLAGSAAVMAPFLSALAWAFVMAFSLWPVRRRLSRKSGGGRTTAALIMTSAIALVLVVPAVLILINLGDDAHALAVAARHWSDEPASPAPQW